MTIKRDCPHCGRPIIDGAIFCLDCGVKIIKDRPTAGGDRLSEQRITGINHDVDIDSLEPGAYLMVVEGVDRGASFFLAPGEAIAVGRGETGVSLKDPFASRRHAELKTDSGQFWLHDLRSANCTFVNSRPIDSHLLRDGDLVEVGYTTLLFRIKP